MPGTQLQVFPGRVDALRVPTHLDRQRAALHRRWLRLGASFILGGLTTVFGLTFAQGAAFGGQAPPDLSTIVLSQTLPGFVASPPGTATNGPLNQSNVNYFGASASAMQGALSSGAVTGYLRTWAHEPLNGDVVVITAFWVSDPTQLGDLMAGVTEGAQEAGGIPFAVPGVSGALGYTVTRSGNQVFTVTFVKGSTAFNVSIVNGAHDLTSADAVSLTSQQDASAPGSAQTPAATSVSTPQGSVAYDLGEAIGGLLITGLLAVGIVLLARRLRKEGRPTTASSFEASFGVTPSPAPGFTPIPLPPPRPPGWSPVDGNPSEQAYWDGRGWTARMRWNGETWVDVPTPASTPA